MPRPLLGGPQTQQKTENVLSAVQQPQAQAQSAQNADKSKLDRLLRKPRSQTYVQTLCGLDVGGHVQVQVGSILRTIREEFPDVEIQSILLGVIAVCHKGDPYEVHTLDPAVGIIEHYPRGKVLPNGMERARGLAMRGGYAFIEVYSDCCRCVSEDGSVAVVPY